ncbi:MAG: EamA family transporter [Desulfobulbus propionicus]|nr:MAG: EamA family transporter [Desulfobulbus propionicus]
MTGAPLSPSPAPSPWRVHALMLVAATLVSTSFTVGKAITAYMDPALLTLVRFLLATLLFSPMAWQHRPLLPGDSIGKKLHSLLRYSMISGTISGFFYLMFLALRTTTSLNTGVIFTLLPGISGIYAFFLLGQHLERGRLIALILAMAGTLWVLFKGSLALMLEMHLNRGDLIFFAGCLLMAFYSPLIKLLHRGESMTLMTFWVLVTGCGWLLVLAGPALTATAWDAVPGTAWAGIAYLAVFSTIITFYITQWATLHLGPTRVMAYSYLYPPLILLLDALSGKGLPSSQTLIGLLLLLPAMYFVQKGYEQE